MHRRRFIPVLASAITLPCIALRAQQKPMPVIGYLAFGTPDSAAPLVAAFRQGLGDTGFVEEQNVAIEFRGAEATMTGCLPWLVTSSPAGLT
jgi:putative ABC transport system substrate-binding protein